MNHEHFKKFWEKSGFPAIEFTILHTNKWELILNQYPEWNAPRLIYRLQGQKMTPDLIWNYLPEKAEYVSQNSQNVWIWSEFPLEKVEIRDGGYWTYKDQPTLKYSLGVNIIDPELITSLNFPVDTSNWKHSLMCKFKKEEEKEALTDSFESFDILQEECAELIQVISKIRRFGINNHNPFVTPIKTNMDHLIEELGDVSVLINVIKKQYNIPEERVKLAEERKLNKLKKWSKVFN